MQDRRRREKIGDVAIVLVGLVVLVPASLLLVYGLASL